MTEADHVGVVPRLRRRSDGEGSVAVHHDAQR
jgi:hypothetical protein